YGRAEAIRGPARVRPGALSGGRARARMIGFSVSGLGSIPRRPEADAERTNGEQIQGPDRGGNHQDAEVGLHERGAAQVLPPAPARKADGHALARGAGASRAQAEALRRVRAVSAGSERAPKGAFFVCEFQRRAARGDPRLAP